MDKIKKFFKVLFNKMVLIDDSPQKIAIGFGLGVFLGILPGTGPIAAMVTATLFKTNKAAALLGSLLTNTWLSILALSLSIRIGANTMGLNWQDVNRSWQEFTRNFTWNQLFTMPVLKMILPVLIGYIAIALVLGIVVYIIALTIITIHRRNPNTTNNK